MWRLMPQPAFATPAAVLFTTALTLLAASAPVQADAITPSYQYTVSGSVTNGSGSHSLAFQANTDVNTITLPGSFGLGAFLTNPLLPGETDTYTNTPFQIDLKVAPASAPIHWVGDFYSASGVADYTISGLLNGSIKSDGTSSLFPTIQSITASANAPFPAADLAFTLPMIVAPTPGSSTPGSTTLFASVAVDGSGNPLPAPAPEPTTIVIFAASLAGWAWTRRRSRTRPGAAAAEPLC